MNYIEDRKFAIDVLKDFNFDERKDWKDLQAEYGEFRSLMDIALVNLWKYLQSEGATEYKYYEHNEKKTDNMLDLVHDKEDFQDPRGFDEEDGTPGEELEPEISFDALKGMGDDEPNDEFDEQPQPKPKRKIRIARPE